MGQRSRKQGVTGKALRVARAASQARDEEAHAIAQAVYNTVRELKVANDVDVLPLHILAPLMVAAEQSAPGAAKIAGLPHTEQAVVMDVAAYLVAGFREMVVTVKPEHFRQWREETDRLSSPPTTNTEEDQLVDHDHAGAQPSAAHGRSEEGERSTDPPGQGEA